MNNLYDRVFKALADENRRRILSALCREPMVAGELGRMVGLAPNAVSFHLKELKAADLVSIQREGRYLRYKINALLLATWLEHAQEAFEPSSMALEAASEQSYTPSRYPTTRGNEPPPPRPSSNDDILPTELL
ncbi:MAG: winged helix-turn-helix transcriptional regulator [Phycisphaerales bacterium]|nr:winged helix-turn-helix transcriptional regulator [Phycisphaerales bacterium]